MDHITNQSIDPNIYLSRFSSKESLIQEPPHPETGIVVVIPSYAEKNLNHTLQSLIDCNAPQCHTEVIVVVNDHKNSTAEEVSINASSVQYLKKITAGFYPNITFHYIESRDLNPKKAGVGRARKTGMDEAVRRYSSIKKNGIIVCLDGDCVVSTNYLKEIEDHFYFKYPKSVGADIYFEHPLKQDNKLLREGILNYELHLRYYKQCQGYCKCPYAFHTVGSSMAVRSEAYQKQGGMNKRMAGEDFYFLHKIIALGNFKSITTATVFPSARVSLRVPFGTGKAQQEFLNQHQFSTYNFEIFKCIREFTDQFELIYNNIAALEAHPVLIQWLKSVDFYSKLDEIKANTTDYTSFTKRLWQWFNAFQFMKLTHFMRDHGFPNLETKEATIALLQEDNQSNSTFRSLEELLEEYRRRDKKSSLD